MQIIKVGMINAMKKTVGCEKAPNKVLNALKEIGSTETGKVIDFDKLNIGEIHVNTNNLEESNYLLFQNSKEIFEKNSKAFFIGGDHSISFPIIKAFNKLEKNPFLIIFDAHADCMNPGKEPTHEEWLSKLIKEGFDSSRIILISARNLWQEEIEFLKKTNVVIIKREVLEENLHEVCDLIMERARNSSGFYISIDIDSVDPAFAPGTGYIEPGGLSSRELIYFIRRLTLLNNFRGADIVEINPDLDQRDMTVRLGAKILAEMI